MDVIIPPRWKITNCNGNTTTIRRKQGHWQLLCKVLGTDVKIRRRPVVVSNCFLLYVRFIAPRLCDLFAIEQTGLRIVLHWLYCPPYVVLRMDSINTILEKFCRFWSWLRVRVWRWTDAWMSCGNGGKGVFLLHYYMLHSASASASAHAHAHARTSNDFTHLTDKNVISLPTTPSVSLRRPHIHLFISSQLSSDRHRSLSR